MGDLNITLFEACEYLNRSKKSVGRYIRQGKLHPQRIKSQQGTLEYRFSKADLEAFKAQTEAIPIKEAEIKAITDETRPDKAEQTSQDKTQETGQDGEVINLLKETTGLLKDQLAKKDEQIKDLGGKIDQLIERDRETNILIGHLQSKVLMLEKPKTEETGQEPDETGRDTAEETGGDGTVKHLEKKGFWQRVFK
jgi:hypothetical protein